MLRFKAMNEQIHPPANHQSIQIPTRSTQGSIMSVTIQSVLYNANCTNIIFHSSEHVCFTRLFSASGYQSHCDTIPDSKPFQKHTCTCITSVMLHPCKRRHHLVLPQSGSLPEEWPKVATFHQHCQVYKQSLAQLQHSSLLSNRRGRIKNIGAH